MNDRHSADKLDQAAQAVRDEYARRRRKPKRYHGGAMFESRLQSYDSLLHRIGLRDLANQKILDVGCANGIWLDIICRRWNARPENCIGVDLRAEDISRWREKYPDSKLP